MRPGWHDQTTKWFSFAANVRAQKSGLIECTGGLIDLQHDICYIYLYQNNMFENML